ncbi:hypothetical protein yc1106_10116 [Curvularia clavata]|uniref:Uncharacterized protein n=1 Tax=Curvularia clavata TaxID=95742 RepID=A0A9Q8ZG90_CURCL|nr:hypothetical protein yc1106_10116 [Curvularia clavata]
MVSLSGFQVLCLILATQAAGNSFPKQAEQDDSLLKKCHAAFVLTSIANVITPLPPAQACFNSWTQYYSTLSSLASKSYTTTLTSTEIFSTYPAVPTSTFCDNIPRLLGRQYSAYVTECTRCVTPTINPYDYNPALLLPTSLVNLAAKKEASYKSCVLHPAAAADATWIPITTLPGDPRYTQGWSATSTIPPTTVTAAPTPEVTST